MGTKPESLLSDYQSLFEIEENDDGTSAAYFPTCLNQGGGECNVDEYSSVTFKNNVKDGALVKDLRNLCPAPCILNEGRFNTELQNWKTVLESGKEKYIDKIERNDNNIISIDKSKIKAHQIKSILRSQCDLPQYEISPDPNNPTPNQEIEDLIDKIYVDTIKSASYAENSYATYQPIDKQLKSDRFASEPDIFPFDISNDNWVKDYNNVYYPKPSFSPSSSSPSSKKSIEPPKPKIIIQGDKSILGIQYKENPAIIAEFDNGLYGRYRDRKTLCGESRVGTCTHDPSKPAPSLNPEFMLGQDGTSPGACQTYFDNLINYGRLADDVKSKLFTTGDGANFKPKSDEFKGYQGLCEHKPLGPNATGTGKYKFAGIDGISSTSRTNCTYTPYQNKFPINYIDLNLVDKCSIEQLEDKLYEEADMTYAQIDSLKDSGRNNTEAIGWIKKLKIIETKNDENDDENKNENKKIGDRESVKKWENDCMSTRSAEDCFRYGEYVQEGDTYEYECGPGMERIGGIPKCEKGRDIEKYKDSNTNSSLLIYPEYLLEGESPSWNLNDFKCVPIQNQGVCNENCIKKEMSIKCMPRGGGDDINECYKRTPGDCLKDTKCVVDNEITNKLCLAGFGSFDGTGDWDSGSRCSWNSNLPLRYKLHFGLLIFAVILLIYAGWTNAVTRTRARAPGQLTDLTGLWYIVSAIAIIATASTLFIQHDALSDYQNIYIVIFSVIISYIILIVGPSDASTIQTIIRIASCLIVPAVYASNRYGPTKGWFNLFPEGGPRQFIYIFFTFIVALVIPLIFTVLFTRETPHGRPATITVVFMIIIIFYVIYILLSYVGFLKNNEGNRMKYLVGNSIDINEIQKSRLDFDHVSISPGESLSSYTKLGFSWVFRILPLITCAFVIYMSRDPARQPADALEPWRVPGVFITFIIVLAACIAIYKNITLREDTSEPVNEDKKEDEEDPSYIKGFIKWLFLGLSFTLLTMTKDVHEDATGAVRIVWVILLIISLLFCLNSISFIMYKTGFSFEGLDSINNGLIGFYKYFDYEGGGDNNNIKLSNSKDYIKTTYGTKLLWDEIVEIIDGPPKMRYTSDTDNKILITEIIIGFKYIIHKYGDRLKLPSSQCGLVTTTGKDFKKEDVKKFTKLWNTKPDENSLEQYGGYNFESVLSGGQVLELENTYGVNIEEAKKIFEIMWNNLHETIDTSNDIDLMTSIETLYAIGESWGKIDDRSIKSNEQLTTETETETFVILRSSIPIIRFILKEWIDQNSKVSFVDKLTIDKYCDYTGKKMNSSQSPSPNSTEEEECNKCFTNEKIDVSKSVCLDNDENHVTKIGNNSTSENMFEGFRKNNNGVIVNNIYQFQGQHRDVGGVPNLSKFVCELDIDIFKKTDIKENNNSWSRHICNEKGGKIFSDLVGVHGEKCSTIEDQFNLGNNQECLDDIDDDIKCYKSRNSIEANFSDPTSNELLMQVCGGTTSDQVIYAFDGNKIIGPNTEFIGEDIIGYSNETFSTCCSLSLNGDVLSTPTDCLNPDMKYCEFPDNNLKHVFSDVRGICVNSPSPDSPDLCSALSGESSHDNAVPDDFNDLWGDNGVPPWLLPYNDQGDVNQVTLRKRYCGEGEEGAEGTPKYETDICSQGAGRDPSSKYSELFTGAVRGDDFMMQCCDQQPSPTPTPTPSDSPTPPTPPSPPDDGGGSILSDCVGPANSQFPCKSIPEQNFWETEGGYRLKNNLDSACQSWANSVLPLPDETVPQGGVSFTQSVSDITGRDPTSEEITAWQNAKDFANQNCTDGQFSKLDGFFNAVFNRITNPDEIVPAGDSDAQDGNMRRATFNNFRAYYYNTNPSDVPVFYNNNPSSVITHNNVREADQLVIPYEALVGSNVY